MMEENPEVPAAARPDTVRSDQAQPEKVLADATLARVFAWGLRDYGEVLAMQERLRAARLADAIADIWLAGEHPTVITQGVRGGAQDLVGEHGYPIYKINRGGQTTLHNPGQLAIYPIIRTQPGLLAQGRAARTLLITTREWLAEFSGIEFEMPKGRPGLYHQGRKVAAIGLAIHQRVSMHGIAINLCNDLEPWRAIIPCGEPETRPVTLSEILGRRVEPAELIAQLPAWLRRAWRYAAVQVLDSPDG